MATKSKKASLRGLSPWSGAKPETTATTIAAPSNDPRLPAARQNVELVMAAGIVNGMDQDTIDARLLAVLDAKK